MDFTTFQADGKKEKIEDLTNNFILGDRVEALKKIPDNSVSLIVTSPPYNVGKPYKNHNDSLEHKEYKQFLYDTWKACYDVLRPGGRIAINVPFSLKLEYGNFYSLTTTIIQQMEEIGYLFGNEIVWNKDNVTSRTAWGSWKSPSSPFMVSPYEMVLVFFKEQRKLTGKKENIDITGEEFKQYTWSVWDVRPETAKHKDHPAPFPRELVYRLIKFYTYKEDIVLDPFSGTGTLAEVAYHNDRKFIYIDNCSDYLDFAMEMVRNPYVKKQRKMTTADYKSLKNKFKNAIKSEHDKDKVEKIIMEVLEELKEEPEETKS